MSARWYKRCGADFIHGTMSLSLEEKGAYSLCLDLIYDRGGPIPDDARWLSGVCGVSIRKWNALRETLLNRGKLYAADGMLSNLRADLEIVSSELQRRNQAESGAKGGRKRAENAGQSRKNNDLAQATLKPIEEIREDKSVVANATTTRERVPPVSIPDWIPVEPWAGWISMRVRKRAKPTDRALLLAIAELDRLRGDGHDPGEVLDQSTRNNWTDVFPLKDKINGRQRTDTVGRTGSGQTDSSGIGRTGRAALAAARMLHASGHG